MNGRKKLLNTGVAACAAALLFVSACSNSSEGVGNDGGAATADVSEVAAAEEFVAAAGQIPTAMTLTTPLNAAPVKGKKLIWLNCDLAHCSIIGGGVENGVTAGGWDFERVNYSSADPATLTAAFRRALDLNPTAVAVSGIPPTAGWQSVVPEYEKRGIPIIASFLGPTELNSTIIANVGGPPDRQVMGETIARWFIADSGGQGKALLQTVDGFPVLKSFSDAFAETVKTECPACEVTPLANTIAQATSGKIVPAIVPALSKSPATGYVISSNLAFLESLPAAMAAAGLQNVKVAGETPSEAVQANLKAGKFAAATTLASLYSGWLMADAAFRHDADLPLPEATNGPLTTRLLTPDSDFVVSESHDYPVDYETQFKKLWLVN